MTQRGWRYTTSQERADFVVAVLIDLQKRQQTGIERFGSEFQGDPLEHAWDELLDGLYYIWKARREREELSGQTNV